jgi:hypothetical protein
MDIWRAMRRVSVRNLSEAVMLIDLCVVQYTMADSPIRQRFASAAESLASTGEATDDEIKEFQDFVMRLLKRSPLERLTALGMLGHSFLA